MNVLEAERLANLSSGDASLRPALVNYHLLPKREQFSLQLVALLGGLCKTDLLALVLLIVVPAIFIPLLTLPLRIDVDVSQ